MANSTNLFPETPETYYMFPKVKEYFDQWHVFKDHPLVYLQNPRLAHVWERHSCAIFVTKDDDVFAIGGKKCKYLGQTDEQKPNEPRKIEALCGKKIISFERSPYTHKWSPDAFAALSEDGKLFMWGWGSNTFGRLGDGSEEDRKTPKLVEGELAEKKVVQVVFNCFQTMVLTEQGQVFTWGLIDVWQYTDYLLPKLVTVGDGTLRAVAVASTCDNCWSFVLLEDGQLYCWPESEDEDLYRINVGGGEKVKQIECGSEHCLALTDSGQIFIWGNNYKGRLGVGSMEKRLHEPTLLSCQFGKAVQIAAKGARCAATFDDGTVRGWELEDLDHYGIKVKSSAVMEEESKMEKYRWVEYTSIDQSFAPCLTWKTIHAAKTPAEELNLELGKRDTDDVWFRVDDCQICAHKRVLTQSLRYFDATLAPRWKKCGQTEFLVEDFDYDTFYAFLHYLYTEELMSNIDWERFRKLADYYCHDGLQRISGKSREVKRCICPIFVEYLYVSGSDEDYIEVEIEM